MLSQESEQPPTKKTKLSPTSNLNSTIITIKKSNGPSSVSLGSEDSGEEEEEDLVVGEGGGKGGGKGLGGNHFNGNGLEDEFDDDEDEEDDDDERDASLRFDGEYLLYSVYSLIHSADLDFDTAPPQFDSDEEDDLDSDASDY